MFSPGLRTLTPHPGTTTYFPIPFDKKRSWILRDLGHGKDEKKNLAAFFGNWRTNNMQQLPSVWLKTFCASKFTQALCIWLWVAFDRVLADRCPNADTSSINRFQYMILANFNLSFTPNCSTSEQIQFPFWNLLWSLFQTDARNEHSELSFFAFAIFVLLTQRRGMMYLLLQSHSSKLWWFLLRNRLRNYFVCCSCSNTWFHFRWNFSLLFSQNAHVATHFERFCSFLQCPYATGSGTGNLFILWKKTMKTN